MLKEKDFLVKLANEIKLEYPQLTVNVDYSEFKYSTITIKGKGVNEESELFGFKLPEGLRFLIETQADENGFEIESLRGVSQADLRIEWVKANPYPKKPEAPKVDKRTKAGKAAAAKYEADLTQFKVDYQNWLKFRDENQPKPYARGVAVVGFAEKGHAEEVMNFYRDTKYWGD